MTPTMRGIGAEVTCSNPIYLPVWSITDEVEEEFGSKLGQLLVVGADEDPHDVLV